VNEPERIIKGLHEAIITEAEYWRVQELLEANRREETPHPRGEFPLKTLLYAPCCGGKVTAGRTTGYSKRYVYYRCMKHSGTNLSGAKMHKKMELILEHLSFKQEHIDRITQKVLAGLEKTSSFRKKELDATKIALAKAEEKMVAVEERLFEKEISSFTYDRWQKKLNNEILLLKEKISELTVNISGRVEKRLELLKYLVDVPYLMKKAEEHSFTMWLSLMNEKFKHKLTYVNGAFRTNYINPVFKHNLQALKEKGLLFLEQPHPDFLKFSSCAEEQIRTATPVGRHPLKMVRLPISPLPQEDLLAQK